MGNDNSLDKEWAWFRVNIDELRTNLKLVDFKTIIFGASNVDKVNHWTKTCSKLIIKRPEQRLDIGLIFFLLT